MAARTRIQSEIIDSRDLIEVLQEIEAEDDDENELDAEDIELRDEIRELENQGIEDWEYGAQFIRDDYFTRYAEELAEDVGAIPSDASWPMQYIDWEAAATALQSDYYSVKFMGRDYWVR